MFSLDGRDGNHSQDEYAVAILDGRTLTRIVKKRLSLQEAVVFAGAFDLASDGTSRAAAIIRQPSSRAIFRARSKSRSA